MGKKHASKEGAYEVEKILDRKKIKGRVHYLVKWMNYGEEENQWVPFTECVS